MFDHLNALLTILVASPVSDKFSIVRQGITIINSTFKQFSLPHLVLNFMQNKRMRRAFFTALNAVLFILEITLLSHNTA